MWKLKKQRDFADNKLLDKIAPNRSLFKSVLKVSVLCVSLSLAIIALINPQLGTKLEKVTRKGVDIVFAVDVSKSMLAEDVAPNRIEKSKQVLSKVISEIRHDRIGIIVYAGNPYALLPITTDYSAAQMFLKNINTDMVPSQGTSISEAMEMTDNYFDDEYQNNKILFIISDGEDHEDNVLSMAQKISEKGVKIFTIGMGLEKGSPIPIKENDNIVGYKKDTEGNVVITKLNSEILKQIASTSQGSYINSQNTQTIVDFVERSINSVDKKEYESSMFSEYESQYQWFLGFAILLLIIDVFLSEKKTLWIQRLNLFDKNKS
ncbi:vWA domain-containing protein [Ichthyobacterium seriolicida]|uniref:Aerotolerance-related protein BatB n=1 Tax=Ichthyobacterium seriolicida TaxID=242600 RepID=A0A1J1E4F0_9FLAO|nr:VWA domain-containing protein [Ichthyobacterium seriolicida]BAV94924.1 aerotolerance-related protein BatB [Ichthyobacterium seriolicida]